MQKILLLIVLLFGGVVSTNAQVTRLQARDAEWKAYSLPQVKFARQIDPDKNFIFRVPADWKQEGAELTFKGPNSAVLRVVLQKIPDGYPLPDYFSSFLQAVKDVPGAAQSTLTRKTQLQDLEAREVFLEMADPEGEMIRSTSWVTVSGPLAITFNLQVPIAHAAEMEPYFKAVVQSVIFVSIDYPGFETLRLAAIKTAAPGPVNQLEKIVASLSDTNSNRESAVVQLAALFQSDPDVAIDLLLDRRALIRSAAVQALARANNNALTPFLWKALDDAEPLVAEAAARSVARTSDVISQLSKHSRNGFDTEIIARVWPFMAKETRIELLQKIFSQTAARPTPPSPTKVPLRTGVKVIVGDLIPVKPGTQVPDVAATIPNDPNIQLGALTLLYSMTPQEFKLPLARLMAANHDPLIAVGLQVANDRGESLPLDAIFKLVASSEKNVSKAAAQNLGWSANVADIPRIEALVSKDGTKKTLDDELKLSIKKIRFRHELSNAKSADEQRVIINKAQVDAALSDFAWRYDCEATVAGCATSTQAPLKSDFAVKPFAENLFPAKVRHYTAIPNPAQAVQNFFETLNGIQMDSPRAQSNVALILGGARQMLAQQLNAPADATSLIEYSGIDPSSPIAMTSWTADKALDSTRSAQRKAIVLRVKDRARFEEIIEGFQRFGGDFTDLADYVGVGTRIIAAVPAFLPLTAQAMLSRDNRTSEDKPHTVIRYAFVGEKEWNGLRIKTIEHRSLNSDWVVTGAATHLVFIGDTLILAPDLATIRDLLSSGNREYLADNAEFRKAIAGRGDFVYFSDLRAVFAEAPGEGKQPATYKLNESGTLNFSGSTWENAHHLVFDESEWSKSLLPFQPKELSAPRDLLPASTLAYYLMNVDLASAWSSPLRTSILSSPSESLSNTFALDLKQDVLPELGPECGVALLGFSNVVELEGVTWAAFCKLKTNKLADALTAGKLFRGVGPTTGVAQVKFEENSYSVAVRNGFFVVSNREQGVAAFDGKSNLASTRDYSKAAEKVPAGVIAFGGYNLEAAIAAASKGAADGLQDQIATLIFSVAGAFHSQNFYATATAGTLEARSSVAMDRQGRYAVADFSYLPKAKNVTLATLQPTGAPIIDQKRLSNLVLRIRAKASGPIDNIKDDIKSAEQTVEEKSAQELILTVAARRGGAEKSVELPVKDPEFEQFIKATSEFAADDARVKEQAREIAGDDRDAWSVARKLADWTHQNLEWKYVVRADAGQTLATREADCSEFSQLFVAMARSLGLPARIVSGLAYSGNSFGGHAWVEVWAGKWIELDPTWGTHFVDATHIRNTSSALVTSAALNLIELEVLETKRTVADFQKSSRALANHLVNAMPRGERSELEGAIDLAVLADEFMGTGSWSKMNEAEREQMSSAYRNVIHELVEGFSAKDASMRIIHLEEKGDAAEVISVSAPDDMLIKIRLVRRNDVWYLAEVLQSDTNLYILSETLRPAITTIEKTRAGQKTPHVAMTDLARVLILLQTNFEKAIAVADKALKDKPGDQSLRFVKALSLQSLDKNDDAAKVFRELSNENFPQAVLKLGHHLLSSEAESDKQEALKLFERYVSLEPYDPRGLESLGAAYHAAKELTRAEATYRKWIEIDPTSTSGYLNLIEFLILNNRLKEVSAWLAAGDKVKALDADLFAAAIESLYYNDEFKHAEDLAASEPARLKMSAAANVLLGRIYLNDGRYPAALKVLDTAAQLDPKSTTAHLLKSNVYRQMSNWNAALKSAGDALKIDKEDGEAYYERACALARMGRTKEAMAALEQAINLYPEQVLWIKDEKDLKSLTSLPAYKKLVAEAEKQ